VLAKAGTALGRLDGVAATLPNPELFVAMYVRREAVLSSQIEGTQSTLDDILAFEIDPDRTSLPIQQVGVADRGDHHGVNHGLVQGEP
jgi:Fic family protein